MRALSPFIAWGCACLSTHKALAEVSVCACVGMGVCDLEG